MTQPTLFPLPTPIEPAKPGNPVIAVYGPGPPGAQCKDCVHLYINPKVKRYYKCKKRWFTNGAATDHRYRWPACGLYQEGEDETHSKD